MPQASQPQCQCDHHGSAEEGIKAKPEHRASHVARAVECQIRSKDEGACGGKGQEALIGDVMAEFGGGGQFQPADDQGPERNDVDQLQQSEARYGEYGHGGEAGQNSVEQQPPPLPDSAAPESGGDGEGPGDEGHQGKDHDQTGKSDGPKKGSLDFIAQRKGRQSEQKSKSAAQGQKPPVPDEYPNHPSLQINRESWSTGSQFRDSPISGFPPILLSFQPAPMGLLAQCRASPLPVM